MGVRRVRVLVVGGGSGGSSGSFGGGADGEVRSRESNVVPGESVRVIVGVGGEGSTYKENTLYRTGKAVASRGSVHTWVLVAVMA